MSKPVSYQTLLLNDTVCNFGRLKLVHFVVVFTLKGVNSLRVVHFYSWFSTKGGRQYRRWLFTLPHKWKKLFNNILFSREESFCEIIDSKAAITIHINIRILASVKIWIRIYKCKYFFHLRYCIIYVHGVSFFQKNFLTIAVFFFFLNLCA